MHRMSVWRMYRGELTRFTWSQIHPDGLEAAFVSFLLTYEVS